ncbi:MAG: 2-oxo acid dehydrogenase subunit E2 [Gammaproteobacteria bacterium]|nr:2-oxo acid dehydrogenase subunit E2 [Gammaproteobacteria bacterium]
MSIFRLPDLGEGLPEAEIIRWLVAEGDEIHAEQALAEMETAKAAVEVYSPFTGKVVTLHGKAGDMVSTGAPLVTFLTTTEDTGSVIAAPVFNNTKIDPAQQRENILSIAGIQISSVAYAIARKQKLDDAALTRIPHTNIIELNDITAYLAGNIPNLQHVTQYPKHSVNNAQLADEDVTEVVLQAERRAMVFAIAQARDNVMNTTMTEKADISDWPAGTDITVKLIRSIITACQAVPEMNSWFESETPALLQHKHVHLGLAVDSQRGLSTPVIRSADTLSDLELRETINQLRLAVKNRTLKTNQIRGATISLSNFGMLAGIHATPIVMPPQVAIVGTGRILQEPRWQNDSWQRGRFLPLSLSFDHRGITGGDAARFLAALVTALSNV